MSSSDTTKDLIIKIAYFTSLAGASILLGFSANLSKFRKNNSETPQAILYEEGAALARKALIRGTIYSFCGFGLIMICSYQAFGKKLIQRRKEQIASTPTTTEFDLSKIFSE